MTDEELSNLERLILRHEGIRLKPYRCSLGFLTVGVGFNIDARGYAELSKAIGRPVTAEQLSIEGLTQEEALKALRSDLRQFIAEIQQRFPDFNRLDPVRQSAVVDFVFNLGAAKAAGFKTTIHFLKLAIRQSDPELQVACFTAAAFHAGSSLWARQVDDGVGGKFGRADRILHMIRTGQFSTK